MDDFWGDIKNLGKKAVSKARDYYSNNKEKIHNTIFDLLASQIPMLKNINDASRAMIPHIMGGVLQS